MHHRQHVSSIIEQGVPLGLVSSVNLSSSVRAALQRDESSVEGVDAFFNQFVEALTAGPLFARLSAAQRAVASEKVLGLRPHFEAELAEFRAERGMGAMVTAEDIQSILPRVMARSKNAGKAEA